MVNIFNSTTQHNTDDLSIVQILASLKDSPASNEDSAVPSRPACALNCMVCVHGAPWSLPSSPAWSSIMRVVFYALRQCHPDQEYFNLRSDVYTYIAKHWDLLCPNKDASCNWKKQVQDMLSHSKTLFESGANLHKQTGFWRLKNEVNPWGTGGEKFGRLGRNSPQTVPGRKRPSDDDSSGSSSEGSDSSQFSVKRRRVVRKDEEFPDSSALFSSLESLKSEITSIRKSMHTMSREIVARMARERTAILQAEKTAQERATAAAAISIAAAAVPLPVPTPISLPVPDSVMPPKEKFVSSGDQEAPRWSQQRSASVPFIFAPMCVPLQASSYSLNAYDLIGRSCSAAGKPFDLGMRSEFYAIYN